MSLNIIYFVVTRKRSFLLAVFTACDEPTLLKRKGTCLHLIYRSRWLFCTGILDGVSLNELPLKSWKIFPLEFDKHWVNE